MEPLRVAIAGLGTVGLGTLKLLEKNNKLLAERTGRRIFVTAISARDRTKKRDHAIDHLKWFDDPVDMAREADADVIVELIGGERDPAKSICEAALGSGRHVVTANKALMATHGNELSKLAEKNTKILNFEAAIAGGIPIVKALREGLSGNEIKRVYGILNGTCNYILTEMRQQRKSFDEVLQEAQSLGYAEAEPSMDVDGIDAGQKLSLLASLAFGCRINFSGVYTEGIRHISLIDIDYAEELGYRIKLLGSARLTENGLEQRVYPCMVGQSFPIANVEGAYNAVVAIGDSVGDTVFQGLGAGSGPTASAVVADLVDIALERKAPTMGISTNDLRSLPEAPISMHLGAYYVRLMVNDRPGVIADISAVFRDENISIESLIQHGRSVTEAVPVVMKMHECIEDSMQKALSKIHHLDSVIETPTMVRIEDLN
ncbi:MAG: homoserine dehydrogenase [Alphaproteobacteria bacterium]|nr:homoserine dehydrogenase [Alphaproteobacteria bacterium]PPR12423.1 MAG: Homoserine dehydrogenase [Alphaproteobacteria bacterium MarineAlpha12_Bin1]|tara:strand:+ start:6311 stop:7603 length:1293 start_codon:yes stop_codon:yes gene_type:complete